MLCLPFFSKFLFLRIFSIFDLYIFFMREVLCLFFLICLSATLNAQDTASLRQQAPHVFIDCKSGCDMNFMKSNLNYVNHVMDMRQADVYIMVTANSTGAGGAQVNLYATNEKTGQIDTIQYTYCRQTLRKE